ncbi:tRNA epoxyqueuosine(34) reductase QueG [Parasphingorhabdus halotolerans]|uniref:Epoxyqueuosine reductase n=1 Tax=Parasphingorhabdus halotolerans TaxID=2725558 RepID=A0A6H2DPG9_9SPHN|nr:tRNA epoxyqueuosine(34) reductase QueG [Parasphingorhabdus halotolerans]QJB70234.1 tRNA epoxyqueuosine(34) reductase QueG [Parasphingorhabdus halotolerans]
MADDKLRLTEKLEKKACEEGFVAFGIAPASLAPQTGKRLQKWLAEGAHGTMIWMEGRADERADPKRLWPEVRSVIMLGMSYAPKIDPFALADQGDRGRISVYAQGKDYHDVVKKALKRIAGWLVGETSDVYPDVGVKVFVDTAPVMEKPLAEAAGIGWQGKHTNIVSRDHGSWLFLGAIYTTLELSPSPSGEDSCGSCNACQDICPTNAFPAPYQLDARACISYLTIEHEGPIPIEYRKAMGNHIYGCDDCLAVCPWNKFARAAAANKAFLPRAEMAAPALADLLALDDASFRAVFSGSPIKRSGRNRIVRNALIAAGNSADQALVPPVQALLGDDNEAVREAAQWALEELN